MIRVRTSASAGRLERTNSESESETRPVEMRDRYTNSTQHNKGLVICLRAFRGGQDYAARRFPGQLTLRDCLLKHLTATRCARNLSRGARGFHKSTATRYQSHRFRRADAARNGNSGTRRRYLLLIGSSRAMSPPVSKRRCSLYRSIRSIVRLKPWVERDVKGLYARAAREIAHLQASASLRRAA